MTTPPVKQSPIARLPEFGQSPWYDNLTRAYATGGLRALMERDGIRGVTSNPTIYEKALAAGNDYDEQLAALAGAGTETKDAYWELVTSDIANAADLLRPVFDSLGGADGFVSVEVDPDLAHNTADTVKQAAELFAKVGRPNVMIKIPGTAECLPAITETIAAGINVNVTLIFALRPSRRGDRVVPRRASSSWPNERRRPLDGQQRRVVLREPGRHRDRPPAPRRPSAARQGGGREREARLPAVRAFVLGPAVGRARGEGRGCSGRCGLRRRRRTPRTRRRSTSTSSSAPTRSTRSRRLRSTRCRRTTACDPEP